MRRGQVEIFGLIMIILILIISGLIFLILEINRPPPTVADTFILPVVAQNFLEAYMHSMTKKNMKVEDIAINCFSPRKKSLCADSSNADCCEYFSGLTQNVLEKTFDEWKMKYRMRVSYDTEVITFTNNLACNDNAVKEQPGEYIIPTYPVISITFDICK